MKIDHESLPPERGPGWPEGDDDVINKYGTYNIQRTNGMEQPYPMIGQGLSRQEAETQLQEAEAWRASGPEQPQRRASAKARQTG